MLDVVHPEAAQATGGWPFRVDFRRSAIAGGEFRVFNDGAHLRRDAEPQLERPFRHRGNDAWPKAFASGDCEFSWSNGQLEITKRFHFDNSYVVHVETITKLNGSPMVAGLGWLGGFGDLTVRDPSPIDTTSVFYDENGKLTNIAAKKLDGRRNWRPAYGRAAKIGPASRIDISRRCFCRDLGRRLERSRRATGAIRAMCRSMGKTRRKLYPRL